MCWTGIMIVVSMVGQGCFLKEKKLSDFSKKIGGKSFP